MLLGQVSDLVSDEYASTTPLRKIQAIRGLAHADLSGTCDPSIKEIEVVEAEAEGSQVPQDHRHLLCSW